MKSNYAYFRFYGSLNDFLPLFRRQQGFRYLVRGNPSIKDTIEALGVPHPEVELILANGRSVNFLPVLLLLSLMPMPAVLLPGFS